MKTGLRIASLLIVISGIVSCKTIPKSRFSKYTRFTYDQQQPQFRFSNDSLKIEGEWRWSGGSRVIPKLSYLPKAPTRIVEEFVQKHGPVLFATWTPRRTKYAVAGEVSVGKKDVRFSDKDNRPFFAVVLLREEPFTADTSKYEWRGRNTDYQFGVYTAKPYLTKENLWVMEAVADGGDMYYDFLCIIDKSYITDSTTTDHYLSRLVEDLRNHLLTQD